MGKYYSGRVVHCADKLWQSFVPGCASAGSEFDTEFRAITFELIGPDKHNFPSAHACLRVGIHSEESEDVVREIMNILRQ